VALRLDRRQLGPLMILRPPSGNFPFDGHSGVTREVCQPEVNLSHYRIPKSVSNVFPKLLNEKDQEQ
jgi:hypothetical protein